MLLFSFFIFLIVARIGASLVLLLSSAASFKHQWGLKG